MGLPSCRRPLSLKNRGPLGCTARRRAATYAIFVRSLPWVGPGSLLSLRAWFAGDVHLIRNSAKPQLCQKKVIFSPPNFTSSSPPPLSPLTTTRNVPHSSRRHPLHRDRPTRLLPIAPDQFRNTAAASRTPPRCRSPRERGAHSRNSIRASPGPRKDDGG